jgi:hypothetical protein
MVAPVNGGSRSIPTQKTTSESTTQTPSDPAAERARQQSTMDGIRKKDPNKLTGGDRDNYASAKGTDLLLENKPFLGFFPDSVSETIAKKMDEDVASYLKQHPDASLKDIDNHVGERFKTHMFSAVVAQKGVDMAIANLKKQLQKTRDGFDD